MSYALQLEEGMSKLPELAEFEGALGRKYLGGGFGGYALYLCKNKECRDKMVAAGGGKFKAVEPYIKRVG